MKILLKLVLLVATVCCLSGLVLRSVSSDPPLSNRATQSSAAASGYADLILKNGIIATFDETHPRASGVAIRNGSIVSVSYPGNGNSDEFKSLTGPNTRVIDLRGKFAMPGFNDAHVHLFAGAYTKIEVNFDGTKSLAEFQQRIRGRVKDSKPGEWILGGGWDHTLWPEQKFPSRQDLDSISTDHPMFFGRVDGHVAVANSRALQIAGVTKATPDPPAGHIERDAQSGEPTGMLEEDSAMDLVYKHVPPHSMEERRRAFELVMNEAAKFGVTSAQDNSVADIDDSANFGWQNFLLLQQMEREAKLKLRVTEWLPFDFPVSRLEEMRRAGGSLVPGKTADTWLKTGTLKGFLDGSLGSRTAALLAPYSDDPKTSGILRVDPAKLKQMAIERDKVGFQLAFHAIGDRANRVALDTFAAVLEANGPRDRRDRVEHAQIVAFEDIARFGKLGIVASMQPSHLLNDQRWASNRLGPDRLRGAYAWRGMEEVGAHLAFGTDFPVEPINPLRGIYACMTRELPEGGPAGGWQPQERLPVNDCLRAYTLGSAYAEFEEQRKGMLKPGMDSDIVVFATDLAKLPPSEIVKAQVVMTIVGGRVVYEQPQK